MAEATLSADVWSDPYNELSFKSEKYAANCTQLHLAGRNINKLRDFGGFISLDTLWLNNNRLTSLQGLEENFRIKFLYLHNNRFRTLEDGVIQVFKFLETLTLNDNMLDDLTATISELKSLHYLKSLDLFDNPIAQEDNYRLRVIGELESLEVFDRHAITEEERVKARKLLAKLEKLNNFSFKKTAKVSLLTPEEQQARERKLNGIFGVLRKKVAATRAFLESEFAVYDKRELGVVEESFFHLIMQQHGLYDEISSEEKELLLSEFREDKFEIPGITSTGTLRKGGLVNYRRFVRAVLPSELRSRCDPWKFEPVPEISTISKDLHNYVRKVERRKRLEEETLKRATMLAGSLSKTTILNDGDQSSRPTNGLSPWEQGEVTKLVKSMITTSSASAKDIESLLKAVMKLGKIPELGLNGAVSYVLDAQENTPIDRLKEALGVPIKASKTGDNSTKKAVHAIMFRNMTNAEISMIEQKSFEKADKSFQSLIRLGNANTSETKTLFNVAMTSSIDGTRLIAHKAVEKVSKTPSTPHEIIASAPNRSDALIIPNLLAPAEEARAGSSQGATGAADFDSTSWASQLSQLGVVDDSLDLAMERKKRSHAKMKATLTLSTSASSSEKLSSSSMHGSSAKMSSTMANSAKETLSNRKPLLPPPTPKNTGWAPSTGTVIFSTS